MRNSSSLDWLRFMHTPNDYRVSPKYSVVQTWCKVVKRKTQDSDNQNLAFCFSDPPGARTQDPNIKSVVLYPLS